jgi:hypothetical protein
MCGAFLPAEPGHTFAESYNIRRTLLAGAWVKPADQDRLLLRLRKDHWRSDCADAHSEEQITAHRHSITLSARKLSLKSAAFRAIPETEKGPFSLRQSGPFTLALAAFLTRPQAEHQIGAKRMLAWSGVPVNRLDKMAA